MKDMAFSNLIFGPVPSRRFGRSLGINNIPPKICSYSCSYCQVGYTNKQDINRSSFYDSIVLVNEVKTKLKRLNELNEPVDYITFVPDGEPTLDINLGEEILQLKDTGVKIAVITNSSLLWHEDVRKDLMLADCVSVKIDSADEHIWQQIDHPHRTLQFSEILDGLQKFSKEYKGKLITETMLVKGVNDNPNHLKELSLLIKKINPHTAYISIPTRPPANKRVSAPDGSTINTCFQIFKQEIKNVEYLIGYEGTDFSFTGNVKDDILSITAVHPMREDAINEFLAKADASWEVIEQLINDKKLIEVGYQNEKFYLRKHLPSKL